MSDPIAIYKWQVYSKEQLEKLSDCHSIAQIICPNCIKPIAIFPDVHTIESNGLIKPELLCPYCSFNAYVHLIGYKSNA